MVAITDASARSTIYETIYDLINTNKSGFGASSNPGLYGGYPDWDSVSFPNIILSPIEMDEEEFTIDSTLGVSTKTIAVIIEIFTKKNKDLDIIADGISNLINGNNTSGLFLVNVSDENGIVFPNETKIKMKTMTFTFMRR